MSPRDDLVCVPQKKVPKYMTLATIAHMIEHHLARWVITVATCEHDKWVSYPERLARVHIILRVFTISLRFKIPCFECGIGMTPARAPIATQ